MVKPLMPNGRKIFVRVWDIAIGALLLASGLLKIQNLYGFLYALFGYQLLGPSANRTLAVLLPFVEVTLGIYLILGYAALLMRVFAAFLFGVFTVVLASAAYRGLHVGCGCFGDLGESYVTWYTVGRTFVLFAMTLIGVTLDRSRLRTPTVAMAQVCGN